MSNVFQWIVNSVRKFAGPTLLATFMLSAPCVILSAQVNVTTWRNDIGRTGQNVNETILTPSNVNSSQFGKLFSQHVDGYVYAQPLYLSSVVISGNSHNVVFVATEHDSVYAFDADSNTGGNANPLWFASMLSTAHGAASGAITVSSNIVGTDILPEIGITGTPVIDTSSGTLYVVSVTQEGSNFVQRLHALDVTSGAEKFGGPVVITATVAGTGNGSAGGTLTFDPEWENQRPGLLLLNGIVYVGFASHGDSGDWHGWILGYNAKTLKQTGAFCASPNGVAAGIWMGGAGLAADVVDPVNHPYGRMFVATGNGDYTASSPYKFGMDFGDSVLNLDLTNGSPTIQDEFTPAIQGTLDQYDGDQGAGGLLIVPDQTTGSYPHLLVQAGKSGTLYLLNRENLGGYHTGGDQAVQALPYEVGDVGTWTMGAYWNGTVYYWAQNDTLKAYSLINGQLTTPPTTSTETYAFPGANPAISANGNANGIVWTIDSENYSGSGSSTLQAHDASNPGTTLYSSTTNGTRDNPGAAVKFTVPTIANGKVYVGAESQVSVFGLLNGLPLASSPSLSPASKSFNVSLQVSMTDTTPGATIYYTIDGSTPTVSSPVYSAPITLTATTTVKALATAAGYLDSPVTSQTYTNSTQLIAPTITPGGGTYTQPVAVTISDTAPGAVIYYTTDGSTPTTGSIKYTGPVTVSTSETLSAIAAESGFTNSPVVSADYTISTGGTTYIDYPANGFTVANLSLNGGATVTGGHLQLTDGGTGEARSAWFATPVPVGSFITNFTFQQINPNADGMTFTIQGNNIYSLGNPGSGLGYSTIGNSIAVKFDIYNNSGEGPDSTGLYIDGASPTQPSIDLTPTGVDLHSGDIMNAQLVYDGSELTLTLTDSVTNASASETFAINIPSTVGGSSAYVGFTGGTGGQTATQNVLSWNYVASAGGAVAAPTFSPAAGTYANAQSVTISDSTAGSTIYYTTDGSTPTTSSTIYSSPISVSSTQTLQAKAEESGFSDSPVASATYTISSILPAPTFQPGAGTFTTSQTVTISDGTPGTTIYFTTNGTSPTTSSAVYGGPITVSASSTLEAIAVETGYTNSPVATAAYVINPVLPTPTFSPSAGTYATTQSVTISDSTPGTTIYYTTNGTTPTTSSTVYSGAISVSTTEAIKAIAVESGYTNSAVGTAVYNINPLLPAPTFSPAAGTYTSVQTIAISDATAGTTIYFTTNGSTPTVSSTLYTGPVSVSTSETLKAIAVESGYTNSTVGSAAYTINLPAAATPTFSPVAGTYTSTQTVAISDTTPSATIYYTTNGTAPTTSSTKYTSPVSVSATETLQAIAAASGYTQSAVSSAAYIINLAAAAAPTFSPIAGTYSSTQAVTISDTTPNATIYYTTNNSAPTTSSAVYSGPIAVSSSETIQAIAAASGYAQSAVSSAAYTINLVAAAAPTFSPSAGTYTSAQTVTISDSTPSAVIYYTTNGTTPTTSSAIYSGPINVGASETLKAIATASGYTQSAVSSATYSINLAAAAAPTFSPAGGTYTSAQTVTITDTTPNAVIYYTTNSTTPTTSSTRYAGSITVSASETLEAIATASSFSQSATAIAVYTITAPVKITPTVTVSPASSGISTDQSLSVTVSVSGGAGNPAPTGSVTLSSGTYTSAAATLTSGSATISIPAGTLAIGTDTLTGSYTPDNSSTATYNAAAATASVSVTSTGYTITATAVNVNAGTSGTSTVTAQTTNGYAGTVSLSCAVTSSPSGAINAPTCSSAQTIALSSGTSSGSATVTITTIAATTASLEQRKFGKGIGGATGGAILAMIILFGIPAHRRKFRSMLIAFIALVAFGGLIACGGVTSKVKTTIPGTTPGSYTLTVTGTGNDSNKTTATGTITLTVN
jgi:hypothetical protein